MDNLEIYNRVRTVPKEAQKGFSNGSFNGTDINPMFRIRILTEVFGCCGFGWRYTIEEHWNEQINDEIHTQVRINLYVKMNGEWSEAIPGIGGNKSLMKSAKGSRGSDEGYKMALTDALSVAAKALGVGADIYWDSDPTKYTPYYNKGNDTPETSLETAIEEVKSAKDYKELTALWKKYGKKFGSDETFKGVFLNHPNKNIGK